MNRKLAISILLSATSLGGYGSRQSSAPYISGDSFRALADHLYDETNKSFDPKDVKAGDIIFIKTDYLGQFFKQKHPYIKNKYIIISHNSDYGAPGDYESLLNDEKIIVWFGQNPTIQNHPKFVPIPIGVANQCWPHGSISTLNLVTKKIKKPTEKKHLLGINFRPGTYLCERKPLYDYFSQLSFCDHIGTSNLERYLFNMSQSKFILSPRGNGLDCHRTWEALLVGSIPILEHSELDELLRELPVLIVDDYKHISKDYLEKKYEEIKRKLYNYEKIYFNYWKNLIHSYKKGI